MNNEFSGIDKVLNDENAEKENPVKNDDVFNIDEKAQSISSMDKSDEDIMRETQLNTAKELNEINTDVMNESEKQYADKIDESEIEKTNVDKTNELVTEKTNESELQKVNAYNTNEPAVCEENFNKTEDIVNNETSSFNKISKDNNDRILMNNNMASDNRTEYIQSDSNINNTNNINERTVDKTNISEIDKNKEISFAENEMLFSSNLSNSKGSEHLSNSINLSNSSGSEHLSNSINLSNSSGSEHLSNSINLSNSSGSEHLSNSINLNGSNDSSNSGSEGINSMNSYDNIDKPVKKKNKVLLSIGALFAVGVLALAVVGGKSIIEDFGEKNDENVSITLAPPNETTKLELNSDKATSVSTGSSTIADVVDNVMPSIVAVNCVVQTETTDFFGRRYTQESESSGSGIIIGQNSDQTQMLIVTNNHVVDSAKSIDIEFCDGKTAKASIKGTDSNTDLAVIYVEIKDLEQDTREKIKIATIGDSDSSKVGETAIAIGNALGYGQSVTVGIISALNREVSIEDCTMTLLQTDAAINPGNSGGALINSKGELIGINSVKYVSEDTEGIGYAIPISIAVPIINDLMNYEEIPDEERGYLGIVSATVSSNFLMQNDISGVVVKSVSKGSPAEKAGIKSGDIITKFDGITVTSMERIQEILKKKRGGDAVELVIERYNNGEYKETTISVELGARGDYVK